MRASGAIPRASRIAAVLSVLCLAAWAWLASVGDGVAAADLLLEAHAAIKSAPAIHIVTEIDDGPGTPIVESWQVWSVVGLGIRTESATFINGYNERTKTQWYYNRCTEVARITQQQETSIGHGFLQRGRLEQNIEYLLVKARGDEDDFRDDQVLVDGQPRRRMSCQDERGYVRAVELDAATLRILRTESWTRVVEGSAPQPQRVVTKFHHLLSEEVDPSLFELRIDEGVEVLTATAKDAAIHQCSINLRDLMSALGDTGWPADTEKAIREWEGFRESMLRCPLVRPTGSLQYSISERAAAAASPCDLPSDVVVFECDRHDGVLIRGYVDGHAMAVPRPQN